MRCDATPYVSIVHAHSVMSSSCPPGSYEGLSLVATALAGAGADGDHTAERCEAHRHRSFGPLALASSPRRHTGAGADGRHVASTQCLPSPPSRSLALAPTATTLQSTVKLTATALSDRWRWRLALAATLVLAPMAGMLLRLSVRPRRHCPRWRWRRRLQ
jgi:hypothetical protein